MSRSNAKKKKKAPWHDGAALTGCWRGTVAFTAGSRSAPRSGDAPVCEPRGWAAASADLNPDASLMRLRRVDVPALRVCCSVIAVVCTQAAVLSWKSMSVFAETCCEQSGGYVDGCSPPTPPPPSLPTHHSSISDDFSRLRSQPQAVPQVAVAFSSLTPP